MSEKNKSVIDSIGEGLLGKRVNEQRDNRCGRSTKRRDYYRRTEKKNKNRKAEL